MPDLSRPAYVSRIEPVSAEHALLALEHHAVLEAAHTRVGQYCQLRIEKLGLEGSFALIDPPGAGPLRFLLRAGGPTADALGALAAGERILVSGPLGRGFAVENARGKDVLLVSAGSGLAAIRPVLLQLIPFSARRVWLYHGTRTLEHVPFQSDLEHARAHGVHVTIAVTGGGGGFHGRVQDAIVRDQIDLHNAVAFVSGMSAMIDSLREMLGPLGLTETQLHLNY